MLIITFQKHAKKNPTLRCTRKDQTVSYRNVLLFMIQHDLAHYAVEQTLNLSEGFYGIIAKGINIHDFELPKAQRPEIPLQAVQIEFIVNLLQTEMADGNLIEDFNATLQEAFKEKKCESMQISAKQVDIIRQQLRDLWQKWNALPFGESLVLAFGE